MSHRDTAIALAGAICADDAFTTALADLIAMRTVAGEAPAPMRAYLTHLAHGVAAMGYTAQECTAEGQQFLVASRVSGAANPTIFSNAHGDTVPGLAGQWAGGRDPWRLSHDLHTGRWYGRGIAAGKGQMLIALAALNAVVAVRGSLGFNHHIVVEMGAEIGSPGLLTVCKLLCAELQADLLIASTGSRIAADTPTVFVAGNGDVATGPSHQDPQAALQTRLPGHSTPERTQAQLRAGTGEMADTIAPLHRPSATAVAQKAERPAVRCVVASLARTDGQEPVVLPAHDGARPIGLLGDALNLPAICIPHACPGCCCAAPNEHMPQALIAEAAGLMAGLYWDLGEISKSSLNGA